MSRFKTAPAHIKDLVPDPENRRRHNPRNLGMVVDALHQVGAARSIVIDEDNVILAGNGVTEAAAEAGITKVRVVEAAGDELIAVRRSGLTPEQKRRLAMYDNRAAELAEWNPEQLAADMGAGLDLSPWFSEDELARLVKADGTDGLTDPDDVPAARETNIALGDMFEMGRHRLLCGDSTSAADVLRVMDGQLADLVFTSPPYGQQRDYGKQVSDWNALMLGVFSNLPTHEKTQVLVNLGLIHRDGEWEPYWDGWIEWMRGQGWRRFGWYVWDQGPGMPGNWSGRLAPSHEFVFHFNRAAVSAAKARACKHAGDTHSGKGQRAKDGTVKKRTKGHETIQDTAILDSVIRVNRQGASAKAGGHPAPFPVGLPTAFLESWPDGATVMEPFSGSGTTLVACEQAGRHCRAIEIEPSYCQISIDRWEQFTGQKAIKVGELGQV
jgi:DNA modification methylase